MAKKKKKLAKFRVLHSSILAPFIRSGKLLERGAEWEDNPEDAWVVHMLKQKEIQQVTTTK